MLRTTGLTKRFGGITATDHVDFELGEELTSLIGPNGAGKTTFFNLLTGQLTPSELVEVIAPMDRGAGASAPVDLLAAKLIERSSLRTIVLDGTDPERIGAAVRRGDHGGTDVVPAGDDDEPTYWAEG